MDLVRSFAARASFLLPAAALAALLLAPYPGFADQVEAAEDIAEPLPPVAAGAPPEECGELMESLRRRDAVSEADPALGMTTEDARLAERWYRACARPGTTLEDARRAFNGWFARPEGDSIPGAPVLKR